MRKFQARHERAVEFLFMRPPLELFSVADLARAMIGEEPDSSDIAAARIKIQFFVKQKVVKRHERKYFVENPGSGTQRGFIASRRKYIQNKHNSGDGLIIDPGWVCGVDNDHRSNFLTDSGEVDGANLYDWQRSRRIGYEDFIRRNDNISPGW